MIGFSRNAPLPTATIPKTSSSRLPSAARATKATLSITHGSRSRRHKLSYNDKATLNNLVRISELHQKQSHWTIENDLYGTPEKLAPVGGFTWACGASVRISRTDKMYRIAIVWPDGEKVFMASKMSNPWTNRNKFTFDTRGLAIYVDMTEQQVRDERKKNYEDSQVPVPENRKEQ